MLQEFIMKNIISGKWLLLVHQIPPEPDAFRVKIWRRLQQVGAVAIKPSVYAMPFSDQFRENLTWTLREIIKGGGDGSIFDMFDGEFTHNGGRCTFEVMVQRFQLQDKAFVPLAEVVHDIDLKGGKLVVRKRMVSTPF
jgi:hypothetical protein